MALQKMNTPVHNITDLSDLPNVTDGLTSEQLKQKFDQAGIDLKNYLNTILTEELDAKILEMETMHNNLAWLVASIQETMPSYSDIYPIGAIYISADNTNPGTLFGGVWEKIEDRFLLASGDTYSAGTTGGEATVTLTEDQMPSHTHRYDLSYGSVATSANSNGKIAAGAQNNAWQYYSSSHTSIKNTGGSQAHNNMPPYLAVYVWKRVS